MDSVAGLICNTVY